MIAQTTNLKHELTGDWSITGVVKQLGSLTSFLKRLGSNQNIGLHVDCNKINNIDISGLQLLHVWRECAGMHGVKSSLINIPDHMHTTILSAGLERCFSDSLPDVCLMSALAAQ